MRMRLTPPPLENMSECHLNSGRLRFPDSRDGLQVLSRSVCHCLDRSESDHESSRVSKGDSGDCAKHRNRNRVSGARARTVRRDHLNALSQDTRLRQRAEPPCRVVTIRRADDRDTTIAEGDESASNCALREGSCVDVRPFDEKNWVAAHGSHSVELEPEPSAHDGAVEIANGLTLDTCLFRHEVVTCVEGGSLDLNAKELESVGHTTRPFAVVGDEGKCRIVQHRANDAPQSMRHLVAGRSTATSDSQ